MSYVVRKRLPTYEPRPAPTSPTIRRLLAETTRNQLAHAHAHPRRTAEWTGIHPSSKRFFTELDAMINDAEVRFWEGRLARYEP